MFSYHAEKTMGATIKLRLDMIGSNPDGKCVIKATPEKNAGKANCKTKPKS